MISYLVIDHKESRSKLPIDQKNQFEVPLETQFLSISCAILFSIPHQGHLVAGTENGTYPSVSVLS